MPTKTITPTDEQQTVIDDVLAWSESDAREYAVGGLAGTGKTTVAAFACDELQRAGKSALFVAPTGKAASVLRNKGVEAHTIHSVIYRYEGKRRDRETGREELQFSRKDFLENRRAFFVVDEASMVSARMRTDLLSYRIPILWIGDHGQLPPVGDDPRIMSRLDAELTTIHRQAANNPIIKLAHEVRETGNFSPQKSNKAVRVHDLKDIHEVVDRALEEDIDQILCGFRNTRDTINFLYRDLLGYSNDPLVEGDRVVCLRNDKVWQVFNGETFTVDKVWHIGKNEITCDLMDELGNERDGITLLRRTLGTGQWEDYEIKNVDRHPFDYANALTCHKAQGAEWESVMVLDEQCRAWCPKRWRYTAVTRAKERLVVYV